MKFTKNTYSGLKHIFDNLKAFLKSLKCENPSFRMIAVEYDAFDKKRTSICFFDSKKPDLGKSSVAPGIKSAPFGIPQLAKAFAINPETAIIQSYIPLDNRQGFFIAFCSKEKENYLLYDFLYRYQNLILQMFYSRNSLSANDIIESIQDVFNDAVKQQLDLEIINALSGLNYERRESNGSIVYVKNRSDAEYKIKFQKGIDFQIKNLRLIRKLLEMCDTRASLVVFNKSIIGIGAKSTNLRRIQFEGTHKWSTHLSPKEMLKYQQGKFFFDRSDDQQTINLPKGFILKKYDKQFSGLIQILLRQKHGALLIISDNAKAEVNRLASLDRGYAIAPINLTILQNLHLIKNLTSIDGAVFIDRQLICYGAGIILDGIARTSGSIARGARYNSARCYLDNVTDVQAAAIIVSEDETVDTVLNAAATKK